MDRDSSQEFNSEFSIPTATFTANFVNMFIRYARNDHRVQVIFLRPTNRRGDFFSRGLRGQIERPDIWQNTARNVIPSRICTISALTNLGGI